MTCPAPESLVPHALGEEDATITRHVEGCAGCRAELARLRETAGVLRAERSFQRLSETVDCLPDGAVADFVEGRMTPDRRGPLTEHLLTCAYCRSRVHATGRLLAAQAAEKIPWVSREQRVRWHLPAGIAAAAAAAILLVVWSRSTERTDSTPGLREPAPTIADAPVPIWPRAPVARVDRFIWSSMVNVARYRLRLYDEEGALLWTTETTDTVVTLPGSVILAAPGTYVWKVEAQTELGRWAGSELTEFRLPESKR